MAIALAAQLVAVLSLPCAVALKASLAADWDLEGAQTILAGSNATGVEDLQKSNATVSLSARSNITGTEELAVDEEAVLEVANSVFPQLNLSISLLTHTTPKLSDPTELNETCRMSNEEHCDVSHFKKGVPTMVYPGGDARCIFGDEYAFSVVPGNREKLLIFFQGGGACWDEATALYQPPTCKTTCAPTRLLGPWNDCPGKNPFKDHTVLFIQSCSGDMHTGQKERRWRNPVNPGVPVVQSGYANVRAAIDWAKSNTASRLTNFALAGESTGAIGVQLWAAALLAEFAYSKAAVVADSDIGIFPRGFQGPMFKDLGVCDVELLNEEVVEWCKREDLSVEEAYNFAVRNFRNVVFGHLLSKHDAGQMLMWDIATTSLQLRKLQRFCSKQGVPFSKKCNLTGAPVELSLTPKLMETHDFHRKAQVVLHRHSTEPNYISYFMSGMMHPIIPYTYGQCEGMDYRSPHVGGFFWGADGWPRWAVGDWLDIVFLTGEGMPMKSRCEQLTFDPDDYCREFQKSKAVSVTSRRF